MLGIAFSVAPSAKAQVSVNVNIGAQPPVYRYVDYGYNYGYAAPRHRHIAPRRVVVNHHVHKVKHRPYIHHRPGKKFHKKAYKRYDNRRYVVYRHR